MDMREGRRRHRASKAKPSQAWLHVVGGNQENVVRVFLFGGRGTSDLSCPERKPVEVVRFGRLDWLVVCTVRNRREKTKCDHSRETCKMGSAAIYWPVIPKPALERQRQHRELAAVRVAI